MDGATSEDVTRAIATFGNKHRIPAKIVVDAGPQLKALSNNPIFDSTTTMGVPVETVAPNHQFLNFSERQIQVFKGLMTTMKKNKDKSIYDHFRPPREVVNGLQSHEPKTNPCKTQR